jgi:hypothetical protein
MMLRHVARLLMERLVVRKEVPMQMMSRTRMKTRHRRPETVVEARVEGRLEAGLENKVRTEARVEVMEGGASTTERTPGRAEVTVERTRVKRETRGEAGAGAGAETTVDVRCSWTTNGKVRYTEPALNLVSKSTRLKRTRSILVILSRQDAYKFDRLPSNHLLSVYHPAENGKANQSG